MLRWHCSRIRQQLLDLSNGGSFAKSRFAQVGLVAIFQHTH